MFNVPAILFNFCAILGETSAYSSGTNYGVFSPRKILKNYMSYYYYKEQGRLEVND